MSRRSRASTSNAGGASSQGTVLERVILQYDRERKSATRREQEQFARELPLYQQWTQQLANRYDKFQLWAQSCSSRVGGQTQCEDREQVGRSRLQRTALRCTWRTFWFARSACLADETQWQETGEQLVELGEQFNDGNLGADNLLLLPFDGMIRDLLFQFAEGKTGGAAEAMQRRTVNRADIDALYFYFLYRLWTLRDDSRNEAVQLFRTNPLAGNTFVDIVIRSSVSFRTRLNALETMFITKFESEPDRRPASTAVNRRRMQPLAWARVLLPLFLMYLSPVSAGTTGTHQLAVPEPPDVTAPTTNAGALLGTRLPTGALITQQPLPPQPGWLQTLNPWRQQQEGGQLTAEHVQTALTVVNDAVQTQDEWHERLLAGLADYDTRLEASWPTHTTTKRAIGLITTYGTQPVLLVSQHRRLVVRQERIAFYQASFPDRPIPAEWVKEVNDLQAALQVQTPALLSDSAVYEKFVQVLFTEYTKGGQVRTTYRELLIQRIQTAIAVQLSKADSPTLREELAQAAVALELSELSVQHLQQEFQGKFDLNATELAKQIASYQIFTLEVDELDTIRKSLSSKYQVEWPERDLRLQLQAYNKLLSEQHVRVMLTNLQAHIQNLQTIARDAQESAAISAARIRDQGIALEFARNSVNTGALGELSIIAAVGGVSLLLALAFVVHMIRRPTVRAPSIRERDQDRDQELRPTPAPVRVVPADTGLELSAAWDAERLQARAQLERAFRAMKSGNPTIAGFKSLLTSLNVEVLPGKLWAGYREDALNALLALSEPQAFDNPEYMRFVETFKDAYTIHADIRLYLQAVSRLARTRPQFLRR